MKKTIYHIAVSLLAVLFPMEMLATDWDGKTTKGEFTLSEDLTVSSLISMTGNLTLTLPEGATHDVIITNTNNGSLFKTNSYRLEIKSQSPTYKVILDGGAVWEEYTGKDTYLKQAQEYSCSVHAGVKNTGKKHVNAMIRTLGNGGVKLENVIIRNIENTTVESASSNENSQLGGAVSFHGNSVDGNITRTSSFKNVTFQSILTANAGAGLFIRSKSYFVNPITFTNCTIVDCACLHGYDYVGGGFLRTNGDSNANVKFVNCDIHHCYSGDYSGFAHWNASKTSYTLKPGLSFENCQLHDNVAKEKGGCITIEGELNITSCTFYNNKALEDVGGVLFVQPWSNIKADSKWSCVVKLDSQTKLFNNEAVRGGALAMNLKEDEDVTGETVELDFEFDGTEIYNNTATDKGGAVYVIKSTTNSKYSSNLSIKGAKLYGNRATNMGGAIYLEGGATVSISDEGTVGMSGVDEYGRSKGNSALLGGGLYAVGGTCTINNGTIENNVATGKSSDNGGGGGIYISGKKVKVTLQNNAKILNNTAETGNGGGCFISGGTITMTGGEVSGNQSLLGDGGAFYATSGAAMDLEGGLIDSNKALNGNGGGIFATGAPASGYTVDITDGTISKNQAGNGGGVYLASGAKMRYNESGFLYNNEAKGSSMGLGGGVYLADGASKSAKTILEFNLSSAEDKQFGYYSNLADTGGDDVYATGNNTDIVLPDISHMTLGMYKFIGSALSWYEDYITDDINYDKGTNLKSPGDNVRRYRTARDSGYKIYDLPVTDGYLASIAGKYLSLTMGYSRGAIQIVRKGLSKGESAIYDVKSVNIETSEETLMQRAYIFGTEKEYDDVVLYNIPLGKYRVYETSWTWYDANLNSAGDKNYVEKNLGSTEATKFEFSNEHKPESGPDATPLHEEKVIEATL